MDTLKIAIGIGVAVAIYLVASGGGTTTGTTAQDEKIMAALARNVESYGTTVIDKQLKNDYSDCKDFLVIRQDEARAIARKKKQAVKFDKLNNIPGAVGVSVTHPNGDMEGIYCMQIPDGRGAYIKAKFIR